MENREPKPSEDKSFTMDDQGTPGEARRKSWVLGMPEGVASLAGMKGVNGVKGGLGGQGRARLGNPRKN